jgi:hypothetical protein
MIKTRLGRQFFALGRRRVSPGDLVCQDSRVVLAGASPRGVSCFQVWEAVYLREKAPYLTWRVERV